MGALEENSSETVADAAQTDTFAVSSSGKSAWTAISLQRGLSSHSGVFEMSSSSYDSRHGLIVTVY